LFMRLSCEAIRFTFTITRFCAIINIYMSSSQRFWARIQSFVTYVKNALADTRGVLAGFPKGLVALLSQTQSAVDGGLEKMPSRRRKPILIATAAVLAVLLLVFVGVSIPRDAHNAWEAPPPARDIAAQRGLIPPEELFLPDEPDFVPGVLLGREQRSEWTAEDAEPWWQNPLAGGEEQWRIRIERMVDEIMESVP